jgi:hypothetical protein
MKLVPFDSDDWESVRTLSGAKASSLVPALRRLASSDWTRPEAARDWVEVRQEIVDGSDVSAATEVVLPWIIELSRGRSSAELLQTWTVVGEVELGRLSGENETSTTEAVLKEAALMANEQAGRGMAKSQKEHGAMISALPELPEWGRMLVLRLVVLGQRYAACRACGELLDLEWDGHWHVGGQTVERKPLQPERQRVVELTQLRAGVHGAAALEAIEELAGVLRCPACGAENDCMALIAYPQQIS